jgi:hypothetical protein
MTEKELFEWLKTCPTNDWHQVGEDGFWWKQQGCIRISFDIDKETDDECTDI